MLLVQAHQDLRVAGADHTRVAIRQVDAGIRHPDVVEDRFDFVFRDLLAQISFRSRRTSALFPPLAGRHAPRTCRRISPASTWGRSPRRGRTPDPSTVRRRRESRRRTACDAPASFPAAGNSRCGTSQTRVRNPAEIARRTSSGPPSRCSWPRMMYITSVGIKRSREEIRRQHREDHGLGQRNEQNIAPRR